MEAPADFVDPILKRVKAQYICKQYQVTSWEDHIDFLTQVANRSVRLLPGGEPDIDTVAINVINDWQRGKLPYFVAPPRDNEDQAASSEDKEEEVSVADSGVGEYNEENSEEEDEDIQALELLNKEQVSNIFFCCALCS